MQKGSDNEEIKKATAQVLDVFNGFEITREDRKGNVKKTIPVPVKYAQRSRVLKSLENRNKTLKLPVIAVSITGLQVEPERVHSLNEGVNYLNEGDVYDIRHDPAVPVKIPYNISFLCRYQDDADQFITTTGVNLFPAIYVVWSHPYGYGNIKSKITYDGSFETEYPEELDPDEKERLAVNAEIQFYTWIFPGSGEEPEYKKIHNINFSNSEAIEYLGGFQIGDEVEETQ